MSGPEIMEKLPYEIGDMVFAAEDIFNDGSMPGIDDEEGLIVPAGLRGVVVHFGVAEMDETNLSGPRLKKTAPMAVSARRSAACRMS